MYSILFLIFFSGCVRYDENHVVIIIVCFSLYWFASDDEPDYGTCEVPASSVDMQDMEEDCPHGHVDLGMAVVLQ